MSEKVVFSLYVSVVLSAGLVLGADPGQTAAPQSRRPDSVAPPAPVPSERPGYRSAPKEPKRKRVVVAVIDTGLDLSHKKFQSHLWSNPNELPNGVDDDGNGLIDDLHGWDFVMKTSALTDSHGHGTHVTGLILEQAPDIEVLPLIYFSPVLDGNQAMSYSLQALEYAVGAGADIINYSGGGMVPSEREKAILELAQRRGILVVAAAGNEAMNTDQRQFFPANYRLSNILSVGAVGQDGTSLRSSNFGQSSVDFAALGERVVSTLPGGLRGEMTGTSQATARVSGIAAYLLSQARQTGGSMSPELIIETLSSIASYDQRLNGRTKLSSRLEDSALLSQVNATGSSASSIDELVTLLSRRQLLPKPRSRVLMLNNIW